MTSQFVGTAIQAARRYGLDPAVYLALIGVESGWNEDVIFGRRDSSAGARGIVQFMIPTWNGVLEAHPELAQDYGARPGPNGPIDPGPALFAGAAHISDMLRAANGDYAQALGGYYAGWGGRTTPAGRQYAQLILSNAGRGQNPENGAAAPLPQFSIEDALSYVRNARDTFQSQTLGPLGKLDAAKTATATAPPSSSVATITAPPPVRGSGVAGYTSVADLQNDERIAAALARANDALLTGSTLENVPTVRQAQLGGIVSGLRDIGTSALDIVKPVAEPVLHAIGAEQQFEQNVFGKPLAGAAINFTPLRFLPEGARNVTEDILSTILVPSTFLVPEVGRAVTVGGIMSRFGLRALANPDRLPLEYDAARVALRALFPNQLRLAAQAEVVARFAAGQPELAARRLSAEKLSAQLAETNDLLSNIREGATQEIRAFGKTIGTVTKEQLQEKAAQIEDQIVQIRQRAIADTRMRLETIATSADPAITDAVDKTYKALNDIALFNQPSRFSPMRLAFWRQHATGFSDEMEQSLRWLIPDLNPPANLTVTMEQLAAQQGYDLSKIDVAAALRSHANPVSAEDIVGKAAQQAAEPPSGVFDVAGQLIGTGRMSADDLVKNISETLFDEPNVGLSELAKVWEPGYPSSVPKWQQNQIDILENALRQRAIKGDPAAIDYFVQVHGADPDNILMGAANANRKLAPTPPTPEATPKVATDPVVRKLAAEAQQKTADNIANWKTSLEWIYNLGAESAFDPKANPGTVYNFAIRASEPLKHIPLIGPTLAAPLRAVGTVFQPIGGLDEPLSAALISGSRYRRAAGQAYMQRRAILEMTVQNKFGKGLVGEAVPFLKNGYAGPEMATRASDAIDRYVAMQGEKGVTFSDQAIADMKGRATQAFNDGVGTVQDAFRNPQHSNLDDESKRVFGLLNDTLSSERDTAEAMGVSIGHINGDYLPQRRVAGDPLKLGTAGRVMFPRAFRERTIQNFDDFVAAAAIDAQPVEHNITNLLDWRLGQSAEKKSFQVFTQMLAANPDMQRFVERPLITRVKGPIDTTSDEFRKTLVSGLAQSMDRSTADSVAEEIIAQLPEKLNIKEAEQLLGKELRVRPVSDFTEATDKEIATKLNSFVHGGAATVPMDQNFVGRTAEALRANLLSLDLSPVAFVQGARLFAQDPVTYLRSIGSSAAWNMTENGRRIWTIQNAPMLRYWSSKGLMMGSTLDIAQVAQRREGESFASWMGRRTATGGIPPFDWLNSEMMNTVGAAKLHIANTTYATLLAAQANPEIWGLVKGLPMFKALTKGSDIRELDSDALARAVADGLNNYIGPVEFSKINAEARPSFLERMTLLTPSWTRGNIGMILNAPKFGAQGVVARHLFMNQLALQASIATRLSLALSGRMPSFDPRDTNFLSVQAPDFTFQPFPTMSAFRLPFRLLAGRPAAQQYKEESVWKERARELGTFFEGRMAQGPHILVDILQGQDYLGRKINSPEHYVVKELMPIALQQILESMDQKYVKGTDTAAQAGLQFLGGQVIPKTPFQLYRQEAELISNKPFDQLTSVDLKRLDRENPRLQELRAAQKDYRAKRGDAVNQYLNLMDDTRAKANTQITSFLDNQFGQPGSLANYAKLSAASLEAIGQQGQATAVALFGGEAQLRAALKSKPALALDTIARDYWSLDPDNFVDSTGKRWSLAQTYQDADPSGSQQQLWQAYKDKRQTILTSGAQTYALTDKQVQQYTLRDWPSVRWNDPRASDLEVRRVGAQQALDQLFSTSPYQWMNGTAMTLDETDRLHELQLSVQQALAPLRATFQAGGRDLPAGTTRRIVLQLMSQARDPNDRKLLQWLSLYQSQRFQPLLRNPAREQVLVSNPDVIKFYPEKLQFLLSSRLLNTPLANDPEVVRIIESALAR